MITWLQRLYLPNTRYLFSLPLEDDVAVLSWLGPVLTGKSGFGPSISSGPWFFG